MNKILVTGGHGFIGKNLVQRFQSEGQTVLAVSRQNGVDLRKIDLLKSCLASFKPDVIYHCAARVGSVHYVIAHAAEILSDNLQMNLNLYETVKEICPNAEIINLLANCSYPGDAQIQSEEHWLNGPVHPSVLSFANSKRALYFLSECYRKQHGIVSKNLILPGVFGPGDHLDPLRVHALDGMILRMLQVHREKKNRFDIWGSGQPVREWVFVADVSEVLCLIRKMNADLTYPVNLAQNKGYAIKESAAMIADLIGFEGELAYDTSFQDGAGIKILDDQKFRSIFPNYRFKDHKEALKETIDYYKAKYIGCL